MKKSRIYLIALCWGASIFLLSCTPALSPQHGQLDTQIFVGDAPHQPLIVGFGGGGGGNDWARSYMQSRRDRLIENGYAVLAIGYFDAGEHTPRSLDRISLDAIADTILAIARRNPQIDPKRIGLIGGSKGGELILNLASRYPQFNAVVAISTSHVSFPALTISANTSSWMYQGKEVNYVPAPFKTIFPAIKGDLYAAFEMMLADEEAVSKAEIKVENINGPILILSAKDDEQWAANRMSNRIIERLEEKNFKHSYRHLSIDKGGHVEPLNRFFDQEVIDFFNQTYQQGTFTE